MASCRGPAIRLVRRGDVISACVSLIVPTHLGDDPRERLPSRRGPAVHLQRLLHQRERRGTVLERRERLDAHQHALERAPVRAPVVREIPHDLVVELERVVERLPTHQRDTQLGVERLDVGQQPRVEAAAQRRLDAGQIVRGAVRCDHDLPPAVVQRIERVGKLLLRPHLVGKELDVVDDEGPDLAEAQAEAIHLVPPQRRDHLVDERLGRHARDRVIAVPLAEGVRDGAQQMGLTEPDATVEEERIESRPGTLDHRTRRLVRDLVAAADDEAVERAARRRTDRSRTLLDTNRAMSTTGSGFLRQDAIHHEADARRHLGRRVDGVLQHPEVVVPHPVEDEVAGSLDGGLPRRRTWSPEGAGSTSRSPWHEG